MPVGWKPVTAKLEEAIAEEQARIAELQRRRQWRLEPPSLPVATETMLDWTPPQQVEASTYTPPQLPNMGKIIPNTYISPHLPTDDEVQQLTSPTTETPLWQKGLSAFTAPFNWVGKNITEPFGAVVTSPFTSPEGLTRQPDESWLDFEKRQYERLNPALRFGIEALPWFLIPGAGQVGTATRAGMGIAGALGKAGQVGKVLGKAVELSPWGLTEKAIGKAVEAVVGKGAQVIPKSVDPRVAEFTNLIRGLKPMGAETRALQHAARVKLAGKVAGIYKSGKYSPEDVLKIVKGSMKGELPKVPVSAFNTMVKDDINYLRNMIHTFEPWNKGLNLNRIPTEDAFNNLLFLGQIPTRGETQLLETVFGKEMVRAILSKRSRGRKIFDAAMDVVGIPKALVSSFDISFPARQGILLIGDKSGAWWKSWKPMMKALVSDKYVTEATEKISSHPLYSWLQADKLYQTPINKLSASISQLEEFFPSRFANWFPWVRGSNRAFGVGGNTIRADTYYYHVGNWLKEIPQGLKPEAMKLAEQAVREKSVKLADYINKATGRGSLLGLERSGTFSEIMNAVFFSPRFVMSRPQAFSTLITNKGVRGIIARDLAIFLGTGMSALTLAKLGGASVELDPRSTDFGKVKIGKTRIDFWGGYQPLVRYTAQFVTEARKTASGAIMPVERLDTAGRFVQSKLSPTMGLIIDALEGQNFIGEPMEFASDTLKREAMGRLVPMFLQDLIDATIEQGLIGTGLALPAAIGASVTTYPVADPKDEMAQKTYGKSFEELSPAQKGDIRNLPEVRARLRPTESEKESYKLYDQQLEDDQAFQAGELTNEQWRDRMYDRLAIRSYARKQWEGKYPEPTTPEEIAQAGYYAIFEKLPENAMPNEVKEAMREAEQYLATLPPELADYVEENRWSNSTPLMKEFKQAQKVLRLYWAVKDTVIRLFGQRFADSNSGKALITKRRKQMRLSNREIAIAYNKFYAQNE